MRLLALTALTLFLIIPMSLSAATWGIAASSTSDSAALFEYNVDSGQFEFGDQIPLGTYGNYPYDAVMRPHDDEVWIVGASGDGVVVIDSAGSIIQEIPAGEYPVSVAFNHLGGIALVSCRDSDKLDIIDLATYTVTGSLEIPGAGLGPGNIIFDPLGDRFFLVEWYGDLLFEIAPDGSAIMDQASVGNNLWQLATDPNLAGPLFVTDRGTDQVRVIDPETLIQIRTVDVGDDPWGLDVDVEYVVVCCEDSHDVFRIDSQDWSVLRYELPADTEPRDVNITTGLIPVGGRTLLGAAAYVCGGQASGSDPLFVFDIFDLTLLDTLDVPGTNTNVVAVEAQWGLVSAVEDLPAVGNLNLQAAPNPFNPHTQISFELDAPTRIQLNLYDLGGRLVKRLLDETRPSGPNSYHLDGRGLASGIYFCRLQGTEYPATVKVQLIK